MSTEIAAKMQRVAERIGVWKPFTFQDGHRPKWPCDAAGRECPDLRSPEMVLAMIEWLAAQKFARLVIVIRGGLHDLSILQHEHDSVHRPKINDRATLAEALIDAIDKLPEA